jgi:hypothetical protein
LGVQDDSLSADDAVVPAPLTQYNGQPTGVIRAQPAVVKGAEPDASGGELRYGIAPGNDGRSAGNGQSNQNKSDKTTTLQDGSDDVPEAEMVSRENPTMPDPQPPLPTSPFNTGTAAALIGCASVLSAGAYMGMKFRVRRRKIKIK